MNLEEIEKEYKEGYAKIADFDYSELRPFIPVVVFNMSPITLKCSMEMYMNLCKKAKSDDSEYSYEELSVIINAYGSLTWSMCDLALSHDYEKALEIFLAASVVWNEKLKPVIERREKLLHIHSTKLTHNGQPEKKRRK
jgi:hypothetical protein